MGNVGKLRIFIAVLHTLRGMKFVIFEKFRETFVAQEGLSVCGFLSPFPVQFQGDTR